MFFGRVLHGDLKFSLSCTHILFCYARESCSRIFLSSVFFFFARVPVRNEQICNRSVLTKTDQLQTNLSSAESVFSLLQTVSLNTLQDFKTADENRLTTDLQMICSICR